MAADLTGQGRGFARDFNCPPPAAREVIAAAPDLCVMTESGTTPPTPWICSTPVSMCWLKNCRACPEDALAMRDAAAANGVICAAVTNRHNWRCVLSGCGDDGRMGRLVTAGCGCIGRAINPITTTRGMGGGPWMAGFSPSKRFIIWMGCNGWRGRSKVSALPARLLNRLEAEDTAVAILRFKSGALGTIEATTSARPRDFEASLHLVGERALAKVGGQALNLIETWEPVDADAGDAVVAAEHSQEVPSSYGLGHGPLIRDVLAAVAGDPAAPIVSVEEGLQSLRLAHALYASMETGGWVDLDDNPLSDQLGIGPRGAAAHG